MHYNLKLSLRQVVIVIKALEFYSRTQIGQFEEVLTVADPAARKDPDLRDRCRRYLQGAKAVLLGFGRDQSYGITSEEVPDSARVARDIHDVLQQKIAFAEKPEGGPEWWFRPIEQLGKEPLPTVTETK
jgi:hypothetical protein